MTFKSEVMTGFSATVLVFILVKTGISLSLLRVKFSWYGLKEKKTKRYLQAKRKCLTKNLMSYQVRIPKLKATPF